MPLVLTFTVQTSSNDYYLLQSKNRDKNDGDCNYKTSNAYAGNRV